MRKLVILLAVVLAAFGGTVAAQDDVTYCGDLSDEDCQILANANPALPSSTAFDGELAVTVDTGSETEEPLSFGLELEGAYATNPDAISDASGTLSDVTLLELSADDWLNYLDGVAGAASAELFIDILPPEGSVPPMFATVPLDLWYVDGAGYIDLSPVAMFAPELDGVFGMSLIDATRFALSEVTVGDVLDALSDMGGSGSDLDGDFGGMDFSSSSAFSNQVQVSPEEGEAFLDEILTITRVEDDEIDGEAVAVFEFDFDLQALIESDIFIEGFEQNAPDDVSFTGEQFAEALSASIEGSEFLVYSYVGLESDYSYGFEIFIDTTLNPAPLNEMFGDEMAEETETFGLLIDLSLLRNSINEVDEIVLPEDAVFVTLEALLEALAAPEVEGA